MSGKREDLQKALGRYVSDTLSYIGTMRVFCDENSPWADKMKTEREKLKQETNSDSLAAVLKETLGGLKELHRFLDAVEKLAVTSLHVFVENQGIRLPGGTSLQHVRRLIEVARLICPLLLCFKRDAEAFFLPRLQNVEVLSYKLDEYITITWKIAEKFIRSGACDLSLEREQRNAVNLDVDLSGKDIERMLSQINQLAEIRMDPHFRLVFLFQKVPASGFITEFSKRKSKMLQILRDLEQSAAQLDSMSLGATVSGVVSSSVGTAGGVLSIVGLVLAPFTFGLSVALTAGGLGMAVTSAVTSAVTFFTELGVNKTQVGKAQEAYCSFMEGVQSIQAHLEKVVSQPATKIETGGTNVGLDVGEILSSAGEIGNDVKSLVKLVRSASSETPAVAKAAFTGTRAVSKIASGVFSGLFLAADIAFLCKDSMHLAEGTETEASKFIVARVELWSSEMKSWQKIHDSLSRGLETSKEKQSTLVSRFYPEI